MNIGFGSLTTNEENATSMTLTTAATTGTGTVIISGATNALSGQTNVNNGTLRIDAGANLGTGPIVVGANATMVGTATLTNPLTLNGHLSPGDPITNGPVTGVLGLGSLVLNSGSLLNYAFSPATSQIDLTGGLTIKSGAGMDVFQSGTTNPFTISGTYDVFDVAAGKSITGLSNFSVLNNPGGGVTYTFGTAADPSGGTYVTLTIVGTTAENWNATGGGSWLTGSNWNPSDTGGPNGVGSSATFPADVPGTSTPETGGIVTLDGNKTLGSLTFNNPTTTWTINAGSPAGTLTIQNFGTNSGTITDSAGNNTINAPMILASNTGIGVSNATNTLTLGGSIGGSGNLTINPGGAGTVILTANNNYSGVTSIQGGTLQVGTGGAVGLARHQHDDDREHWHAEHGCDDHAKAHRRRHWQFHPKRLGNNRDGGHKFRQCRHAQLRHNSTWRVRLAHQHWQSHDVGRNAA